MNRRFLIGGVALCAFLALAVPLQLAADTKEAPKVNWQLTGSYFENCSCNVACPCEFSANPQLTSAPSEGYCHVPMVFHIDRGRYGNVTLDGLNAVVVIDSPGTMGDGNWSVAPYIDASANEQQRAALLAIFTGSGGGPMAAGPMVSKVLGVKYVPITFTSGNMKRSAEIPGVLHVAVHAIPSGVAGKEIWATNVDFVALEGAVLAVGEQGSTFTDYDRNWDNSGHNGFYAPIKWSNK
jgi:hypothetical protein